MRYGLLLAVLLSLLSIFFFLPNFLSSKILPQLKINLGLDLRGGSSMLLKIDFDKYLQERLYAISTDIVNALKANKVDVSDVRTIKGDIFFKIVGAYDLTQVKKSIKDIDEGLSISYLGTNECKVAFVNTEKLKNNVLAESISSVQRRVDASGTREVVIQSQGSDAILVQVPGLNEPEQLRSLLGKTAKLSFHLLSDKKNAVSVKDKNGNNYPIKPRAEITGGLLSGSSVTFNKVGDPVVTFSFNIVGAKKFAQITKENVGKPFAILLDGQVLTAPIIREPILVGKGEISGNFTLEEAHELSILLRSGVLPAPLEIIEERVVGPSLGSDAIKAGINASIISIVVISLFMFFAYGSFGICAAIALFANIIIMLACLTIIGATLTLPGIAGVVLTIGMAVDANVLIFERMKEEMKNARKLSVAITRGFKGAMTTILDSNITTLIAALIMFFVGVGPVRGFAVTLSIGIMTSMFSAIVITRELINLFIGEKSLKLVKN